MEWINNVAQENVQDGNDATTMCTWALVGGVVGGVGACSMSGMLCSSLCGIYFG